MPPKLSKIPLSIAHLSELEVPPPDLIELSAKAGFSSVGRRIAPGRGGMFVAVARKPQ